MIDHITLLRAEEAGLPAAESHPDPALVCFPMRIDWEQTLPAAGRDPFPSPLQPAIVRPAEDWPDPVADLAAHARLHGWEHRVTFAHGWTPHASYGTPSARPKQSWAIRMHRGAERAVAVRMDGSWTSLWYWSPRTLMTRNGLLVDFRKTLSTGYPQASSSEMSA